MFSFVVCLISVSLFLSYAFDAGRADFIGGIDNEALEFDQLESFVSSNESSNSLNQNLNPIRTTSITLSVTSISTSTTAPQIVPVTTALGRSHTSTSATSQSHLPESPPDSGSEPPYSPTDMHAINNLNQLTYPNQSENYLIGSHQSQNAIGNYPTNDQQLQTLQSQHHQSSLPPHQNQIQMRYAINLSDGSHRNNAIHKTEDIMLSSALAPIPVTNSSMSLLNVELIMQQNVSICELAFHYAINRY